MITTSVMKELNIETKHVTETSLLHILSQICLKSFHFITNHCEIVIESFWTRRRKIGKSWYLQIQFSAHIFYIFKPEISFFDVFIIFWISGVSESVFTNVFKYAFRFHAFLEIPEMLETYAHKKFNFQRYRVIKMSWIIVFSSNREIKIPRNSKFVQINPMKLKCHENFLP